MYLKHVTFTAMVTESALKEREDERMTSLLNRSQELTKLVGKVDQACSNGGRAEEDEGAEDHHDPVPKREAACGHGETDEGYRQDTQGYGGIGKDGVR